MTGSSGRVFLPADVPQQVRANTGPAALAGAVLMVYGFFMLGGPSGVGWFRWGDWFVHESLRVGGLAMIGVAVWSAVGHLPALRADALISAVVGVGLLLGAVLLTIGGGFSLVYPIYAICGFMMLRAGWRVEGLYRSLLPERALPDDGAAAELSGLDVVPSHQDAGFLGDRRRGPAVKTGGPPGVVEFVEFDDPEPSKTKRTSYGDPDDEVIKLGDIGVPPPEGFVSKLAPREKPPH